MPKGQSPKLKGAICNVPIDVVHTCNTLPRTADSNGLLIVKLKRKLVYRGHVYFEPVRPSIIFKSLQFLKENNPMYYDIDINLCNIPDCLIQHKDSNINVLDYVTLDELIPMILATGEHDSNKYSSSDKEVIQDALTSINNDYRLPIFLEKERVNKSRSDGIEEVEPVDFEINSCRQEVGNTVDDDENPLDVYKCASNETVLITRSHENEFISIALGEDSGPLPFSHDLFCEELSHPHLFPLGKFGFQIKGHTSLSPTKYFNQRLLNYTQKFSSDSDYIFFAHKIMQSVNLNNQINIAMRKVASNNLTAGMLCSNFKEKVKDFIASDQAFTFMSGIKGTPAYWKKFLFDVLAMVRQLGCPTFFMTLSSADLRWNELVSIISDISKLQLSEEDIAKMSYQDRCNLLNSNPVLVARHFQYRVEIFLKK